jgi:nucleoside-diphosphate-sugar epimerase
LSKGPNHSVARSGRLLITGAPGWLCDALIASHAKSPIPGVERVRCLVHASLAHSPESLKGRWGADVEVVAGDLTDAGSLAAAVRDVDRVVHGAAIMHVERVRQYYEINTEGTRSLALAAAAAGVRRFVFLSSNAAGGRSETPGVLMRESDASVPRSPYGHSKWLAEQFLLDVTGPMERTVLRPCMFYGPPVPERHVDVYKRIIAGRMPLVGHGDYARSLTHIDNLVEGVRAALERPEANRQTYYIADARTYSTRQVVDGMAAALGVKARYIRLPEVTAKLAFETDRALSRYGIYWQTLHLVGEADWDVGVSIEKARRELGYDPKVEIDEGMRGAVAWCRSRGLL